MLDCQVRPLANQALATPALLQLARQVCWSTIFPAAAPEAFGADERINAITDPTFWGNRTQAVISRPRTYGLTFGYSFKGF